MGLLNFLKPAWKHSNPSIRAAAIQGLAEDQQDILLSIALQDSDVNNRKAASKKITEKSQLQSLLAKSDDTVLKEIASKKISELLTSAAKNECKSDSDLQQAKEALSQITEQKWLEDIAQFAKSVEIRKQAYSKLTHASAFFALAQNEENADLALVAFAKVTRVNQLESLSKNAKSAIIRKAAKEKIKDLEKAQAAEKKDAINLAKLNVLMQTVENIRQVFEKNALIDNWKSSLEQLEDAEKSLQQFLQMGLAPTPEQAASFRISRDFIRNRMDNHAADLMAKQLKQLRHQEILVERKEICNALEGLVSEDSLNSEALSELKTKWRELGTIDGPQEEEIQATYRNLCDNLQKAEWRRQKTKEEALRRVEEDRQQKEQAIVEAEKVEGYKLNQSKLEALIVQVEATLELHDMREMEKVFKELSHTWKNTGPAPEAVQTGLLDRFRAAQERYREIQDWLRWSNLRSKQEVCDKLEALLKSEIDKGVVQEFKALLADWKSFGPVPWDSSEALWERYHQVCDSLYEKTRGYFAELEEEREGNLKSKEELCAKVEALAESTEWREAMDTVKEAQSNWKAIGAVPREQSEALWTRFKTACDLFYGRREKYFGESLVAKVALCELVESLQDSTAWKITGQKIKEAQEQWKTLGPVARKDSETIWNRFHTACDKFYQARHTFMEQLDSERPFNLAKKEELCRLVETIDELATDEERYNCIREAQVAWKEIGPVTKEQEQPLWERFRKPCDAFFESRKAKFSEDQSAREENQKLKEELCVEAESLMNSQDWKNTIEKYKVLQEKWKAIGQAPREIDNVLWKRYRTACDGFFTKLKANSALMEKERQFNLKKKEDLCFEVEAMLHRELTPEEAKRRMDWQLEKLSKNFGYFQAKDGPIDWKASFENVKAIQKDWKKIGHVPRDKSDAIWDRFHKACDDFFEERRKALGLPESDPAINLERKLEIITEAESIANAEKSEEGQKRMRDLQRNWKRIGPVPQAQNEFVWKRFRTACDTVLGAVSQVENATA